MSWGNSRFGPVWPVRLGKVRLRRAVAGCVWARLGMAGEVRYRNLGWGVLGCGRNGYVYLGEVCSRLAGMATCDEASHVTRVAGGR